MAFTMHSHSGQFCPGHAVDQLEDIVRHAVSLGYKTMGLTEHMPRYEERDLYPDERAEPQASLAALAARHEAYLAEAQRLRDKYADRVTILVGFEAEFIRPAYGPRVRALAAPAAVDYFIGSVHHVHGLPIDYDGDAYAAAARAAGGDDERLAEDYYDLQRDMLEALAPPVVGHFDLVRLLSAAPDADPRRWPGVWDRVCRNLRLVARQGGWLECNTAALRKGLREPYPGRAIAEEWLRLGGCFTMSDDSHGIGQLATNYARGIAYLDSLGVEHVWTLRRRPGPDALEPTKVALAEFRKHFS
ncbi:hypothetical protein CDD83_3361 [Cordyceps sp. RAO-2017]|nr:hypothetical protein CDD83_3361 [Cordyceps sp. RAO-2017]